jgi:YhhN family
MLPSSVTPVERTWLLALLAVWAMLLFGGFELSDTVLAAHLFNDAHFLLVDDVIWLTYGPGQMLIVDAAGGTLGLVGR